MMKSTVRSLLVGLILVTLASQTLAENVLEAEVEARAEADVANGETTTTTTTTNININIDNNHSNSNSNSFDNKPPLTTAEHGRRQIEWVRSKGGFVHEAFEIRLIDLDDPTSRYGVIVNADIAENEVLLVIPRDCLIDSEGADEDSIDAYVDIEDYICVTVAHLAREMQLGTESKYEPYVSYLNSQAYGQLPTMWTEGGKEALVQVLGWDDDYQDFVLPPSGALNSGHGCITNSVFEKNAEMLVRQRSWDDILIPVWDMVSHRNGRWLNVEEKYSVHDTDYNVTVIAIRDIQAGEELYMSYNYCRDCGNRETGYGTAEILRDYGFVEAFPQKWVFPEQEAAIELDYEYKEDGSIVTTEDESGLVFSWLEESAYPDETDLAFFEEQIQRLQELDLGEKPDHVPSHEWDVVLNYKHAILVAMQRLVADAETSKIVPEEEEEDVD